MVQSYQRYNFLTRLASLAALHLIFLSVVQFNLMCCYPVVSLLSSGTNMLTSLSSVRFLIARVLHMHNEDEREDSVSIRNHFANFLMSDAGSNLGAG